MISSSEIGNYFIKSQFYILNLLNLLFCSDQVILPINYNKKHLNCWNYWNYSKNSQKTLEEENFYNFYIHNWIDKEDIFPKIKKISS